VRTATRTAVSAGSIKLPIKPAGKAARRLSKRGMLKLEVKVTFAPAGGTAATKVKVVRLRRL
jgi:hypothetical protein